VALGLDADSGPHEPRSYRQVLRVDGCKATRGESLGRTCLGLVGGLREASSKPQVSYEIAGNIAPEAARSAIGTPVTGVVFSFLVSHQGDRQTTVRPSTDWDFKVSDVRRTMGPTIPLRHMKRCWPRMMMLASP
jgi:hypothetical protein